MPLAPNKKLQTISYKRQKKPVKRRKFEFNDKLKYGDPDFVDERVRR
jgi:hypothetical protein